MYPPGAHRIGQRTRGRRETSFTDALSPDPRGLLLLIDKMLVPEDIRMWNVPKGRA